MDSLKDIGILADKYMHMQVFSEKDRERKNKQSETQNLKIIKKAQNDAEFENKFGKDSKSKIEDKRILLQMAEEQQPKELVPVENLTGIIQAITIQRNTSMNKLAIEQARTKALLTLTESQSKEIARLKAELAKKEEKENASTAK